MENLKKQGLIQLFESWAGEKTKSFTTLPPSGSYREYYRIQGDTKSAIGVFNQDKKENRAFLEFTKHFLKKGLPVPELYGETEQLDIYLLEDLGDDTLFSLLQEARVDQQFPPSMVELYKRTIESLIPIQVKGKEGLDLAYCYPRAKFDEQSIAWDLNYFKYYYLKPLQIPFDEQLLENDFEKFATYLMEADCSYFLYRDCQSRNIMIHNGAPYFIDYQGGREGALQYDLASLLYQARANIPQEVRDELIAHYIETLEKYISFDKMAFLQYFYAYVLARQIQVLGAYGFRGYVERKQHFLKSVPFARKNLALTLDKCDIAGEMPHLFEVLEMVAKQASLDAYSTDIAEGLTIRINSFSYRQGIPDDYSGHGGGFVFDCRSIHNPGRYAPYLKLTGRDKEVIQFLEEDGEITLFLSNVYKLVGNTVEKYLSRNFKHLMVSFGCTGGQHRSVYCADKLSAYLEDKYPIKVVLTHVEQERKGWQN